MSTDPMDEIADAARRKQARDRAGAPVPESLLERDQRHARCARELLRESLAGHADMTLAEGLAATAALLLPIALVLAFAPERLEEPLVLGLTVLAAAASIFAQISLTDRLFAAIRASRLRSLGHGFDANGFLQELSRQRRSPSLVMELQFERPWKQEDQLTTLTALGQWVPNVPATWKDPQRLVLSPRGLKGTATIHGKGLPLVIFTNRELYDCFARVLDRALPVLHRANPVVTLSATLSGDVTPWDEDAAET